MSRIYVEVWTETDPALHVRVGKTSGAAESDDGDQLLRPAYAARTGVATALALSPVVAFGFGEESEPALRAALAMGADRAVLLSGPRAALGAWLRLEQPKLVIGARDAGLVAAKLGWAHLAGLDQLCLTGSALTARRALGRGEAERVRATLPAVVRLAAAGAPPYLSRRRLAAGAERTIERAVLPELPGGADGTDGTLSVGPLAPIRARTKSALPTQPSAAPLSGASRLGVLLNAGAAAKPTATTAKRPTTPAEMAEELVRYLAHQGLLPHSRGASP